MAGTGHKTVRSGKRVRVKLRDGGYFYARFKENKGRYIEFWDHEPVRETLIKGLTIWKEATPLSSTG